MARKTEYLNLHLPDENEFYDVEKDQNQNFEKLDTKIKELDNLVNSKENKISKNSAFNLNKSDDVNLANSNILATSMAIKKVNDIVNTKEPKITKKNGFNLDKSDNYRLNNTNILLTTHGSYTLYTELLKTINTLCPYKVGDIYITTNSQNPAVTWVGTKWQKIEGRFLRAANSGENAVTLGGSDLKILSVANLPTHSHTISIAAAGSHTHTQVAHIHTQPAHTHKIPIITREGWGTGDGADRRSPGSYNSTLDTFTAGAENTGAAQPIINASGNHTHTASASNTGSGVAFDIKPAYYTVHIWRRIG